MQSPVLETVGRDEWVRCCESFADHNYRHCWDYGQVVARRHRASSEHRVLRAGGRVVALAEVRVKSMPLVGGGIAYVSGGPLFRAGHADEMEGLKSAIDALRQEYVQRRGLVLRIAPRLNAPELNDEVSRILLDAGMIRARTGQSYRTFLLPLNRPAQAIRAGFAQKWRNCLNKAERGELDVTVSADAEALRRFVELFREFVLRKSLHIELDADFYTDVQARLPASEALTVVLAEHEGKLVAGHVSSAVGDTCVYLLGATDEMGLRLNAAYVLQWVAISMALERGCRWYDLGGIDPDGNPGVYHFKKGLGGIDVTAPGPFEAAPAGLRSRVALRAEGVYRSISSRQQRRKLAAATSASTGGGATQ